jgi:integrase/recombinase XerC
MTTLTSTLTEQFLREGTYLRNWSPRTVTTHRDSLATLPTDSPLTKDTLNAWVTRLRERGITAGAVNLRARSLNSFFSWLHQEGHAAERLRVKMLPNPLRPINLLRDEDVRRLVAFRPSGVNQRRAWTLAITLLDTGLRIDEALGLESANVNLDDLVIRLMGKGRKERLVPVSSEARKHRWLAGSTGRYVFGVREGGRMSRTNARRDIRVICKTLGITAKTRSHTHKGVAPAMSGGDYHPLRD